MITTSIAIHCEACATYHSEAAFHSGATLDEMKEAIIVLSDGKKYHGQGNGT
jgi:AhpD family alkylhydroperoxidase